MANLISKGGETLARWGEWVASSYQVVCIHTQADCMLLVSQWEFLINSDFRSYQWYVYWLCCIHQAASLHFLSTYRCPMCHYTICMHRSHFQCCLMIT